MSKNTQSAKAKQDSRKIRDALTGSEVDALFVGLDVHKKKYPVAVWKNDRLAATWVMPADHEKVVAMLEPARECLKLAVYEAGPTGYGLARALQAAGFPARVAAPNKTPKPSQAGNKSDRLDCGKLAEYAAKDLLKYVAVPSAQAELDRLLVRTRDDQKKKRTRVMRQIKSLLLQFSLPEPEGLKTWTRESLETLRELKLPAELRFRLDELLAELTFQATAQKRTEQELKKFRQTHAEEMEILQSHPGIGPIVAQPFLAEVFQPGRFKNGKEVAAYLGLAPKVIQTGETRREGDSLPGGRGELRAMLVEACWVMVGKNAEARAIYLRRLRNTGNVKKAVHGLARRVAVRLWTMLTRREPYRKAA